MSPREVAILALLAAIWGASFLFIKIGLSEMSPAMIAAWRVGLAAVFLGVLASRPSRGGLATNASVRQWRKFLVLAVFNAVIPYLLIAWGEQHITSGLAAIFNGTTPLFSFVLGYFAKEAKEGLGVGGIVGLVVGIAGVTVLVGSGSQGDIGGEAAVTAASASYAVAGNFAREAFRGQPILVPALGQNVMGSLLLIPVALVWFRPAAFPSARPLLSVLALGLAGTGFAYVLYYWLIAHAGPTRTLTVTYLLPVTALGYGAIFLGEPVGVREVAGLALILAGIAGISGYLKLSLRQRSKPGGRLLVKPGMENGAGSREPAAALGNPPAKGVLHRDHEGAGHIERPREQPDFVVIEVAEEWPRHLAAVHPWDRRGQLASDRRTALLSFGCLAGQPRGAAHERAHPQGARPHEQSPIDRIRMDFHLTRWGPTTSNPGAVAACRARPHRSRDSPCRRPDPQLPTVAVMGVDGARTQRRRPRREPDPAPTVPNGGVPDHR